MAMYKNGEVPASRLVSIGSGYDQYGRWEWLLPPATVARVRYVQVLAFKRTGKRLEPSPGYSCYRPLAFQVIYKKVWGIGAATPRTSSHGGEFKGRDAFAVDFGNWSEVYGGDRAAFYADLRAAGFTPGVISPANGYPDEPWHAIDYNGLGPVPAFAGVVVEFSTTTPTPEEKEDDMGLRIITSPSYRGAGKQVIHNGSVVDEITNAEALDLRGAGVPYNDYDHDYKLLNEVNRVWALGGLDRDAAAKKTAEMVSAVSGADPQVLIDALAKQLSK